MRSTFRAVLALALALVGGGAFAQVSASDSAFDRFYAQVTGVGKQTVTFGSGGQPVVGQGVPQISSSGGPVNIDRTIPLKNNSGGVIDATARVPIPPAALGKIIRRGLELAPVLGAGIALYDLVKELGFDASKAGGTLTVSKPETVIGANCGNPPPSLYPPPGSGCYGQYQGGIYFVVTSITASGGYCYAYGVCSDGRYPNTQIGSYPVTGINPTATPLTLQQLEDAIASKSGWPSSSKVSQAVADSAALEKPAPFSATPQVTGPATSPGTTKTTLNIDNSTTTTTTQHQHTYTGNTINTTTTTVTSTCNGGSCNTTTETETPKLDEQPFAMPCGVPGTPPCAVKVDETGVPNATDVNADRLRDLEEQNADWIEGLVAANPFPDINWAFELPTACGVIPTPAFAPAVDGIDVCQFQPMFHELMTVVWMLGGLFGAISLFMRNALTT